MQTLDIICHALLCLTGTGTGSVPVAGQNLDREGEGMQSATGPATGQRLCPKRSEEFSNMEVKKSVSSPSLRGPRGVFASCVHPGGFTVTSTGAATRARGTALGGGVISLRFKLDALY